jgi:hypothetical protein
MILSKIGGNGIMKRFVICTLCQTVRDSFIALMMEAAIQDAVTVTGPALRGSFTEGGTCSRHGRSEKYLQTFSRKN